MQTRNKMLDDISQLMTNAMGVAQGAREEAEIAVNDRAAIEDELGDLLFSCVNLARHLEVDPERALRQANGKFQRRFQAMEELAERAGNDFSELSTEKMEQLWVEVKLAE